MTEFNPVLHGLRGIAASMVLLFHWYLLFPSLPDVLANFTFAGTTWNLMMQFGFGWLGVPLFFILSGYLLGSQLLQREISTQISLRFWKRRFFRIYPAVWAQIIILTILKPSFSLALPATDLLSNILLWINLPPLMTKPLISSWWTLPVELGFYLIIPFLVMLQRKIGWISVMISSLILTVIWRIGIMYYYQGDNYLLHLPILDSLPGTLSTFIAGMSLAYIRINLSENQRRISLFLITIVFISLQYWLNNNISSYWSGHWMLAVWNPLMAIVIATGVYCLLKPLPESIFLTSKPFVFLGEISFGIYLWHLPVQYSILIYLPKEGDLPVLSGLALIFSFAITIPVAALSYYLIEQPIMGWGKRKTKIII